MVTMTDDRRTGYAFGASDYLTKPIDPGRLTAALRRQLGDAGPPASVLVVDDDPAVRRLTQQVLHREGWTVVQAENGRIGLRRIAECRPALIILDLVMPDMDGFEFLDTLRRSDGLPAIPIIVLTAKELTAADRESLNGSVAKVLDKSICNREDLLVAVREQVRSATAFSDRGVIGHRHVQDSHRRRQRNEPGHALETSGAPRLPGDPCHGWPTRSCSRSKRGARPDSDGHEPA